MTLTEISPEVLQADGPISTVGPSEIDRLRHSVATSPKGRARINAHPNSDDSLHEMIIAIDRASYIRPHIHPAKSEAFHILEGEVDIVIFKDDGTIDRLVPLGAPGGSKAFYYRMSQPFYHTLLIRSDLLIVHEITNGPFRREGTLFAPFAPPDDDPEAVRAYQADLHQRAATIAGAAA